jgi:hypothetical protein
MATINSDINSLIYSVSTPAANGESSAAAALYSPLNGLGLPETMLNNLTTQGLSLPPTPAAGHELPGDRATSTDAASSSATGNNLSSHGIVPTLQ